MSFTLKALEKLVDRRIRNVHMRENPLSNNQHAYRSGFSTITALHCFLSKIEEGLSLKPIGKEKVAGALVLMADISGAFDNVKTQFIIDCARRKGIPEWSIDWIKSMLETRQLTPASLHCKERVRCTCGTPQGSCSGPLQWCLCADDLLEKLHKENIYTIGYADDFACTVIGNRDLPSMYDKMNKASKVITDWCKEAGLDVNPQKTELIMFSRNNYNTSIESARNLSVRLKGEKLKLVDCVTYLGMKLDKKLNMKDHIKYVQTKANKALWAASMITGKQFGATPHVIRYIYESIVIPRITYGSLFYWHKVSRRRERNGNSVKILDSLQNTATLLITGAMKTTPRASLNGILHLAPLDDIITISAIESMNRLISSGFWKNYRLNEGYRSIESLAVELELRHKSDCIAPICLPEKRFNVQHNHLGSVYYEDYVKVFVDASVKNGRSGIGGFSEDLGFQFCTRTEDLMNINLAELKAISICSGLLIDRNVRDTKIAILSDSKEALKLLERDVITSDVVINCIKNLNRLSNLNLSVEVAWNPKNTGTTQHKKADELSRWATDLTTSQGTFLTRDQLKDLCTNKKRELMATSWDNWVDGMSDELRERNVSIKMFNGPHDPRLRHLPKLNKKDMRTLVGLLTGHCTLKHKLVQMKKGTDSSCRWCSSGEDETSLHVLMKCSRQNFIAKRKEYFGKQFLEETDLKKIPLISLIRFARDTGIQEALCFRPP